MSNKCEALGGLLVTEIDLRFTDELPDRLYMHNGLQLSECQDRIDICWRDEKLDVREWLVSPRAMT
jgi:hypothetical protein